MKTQILQRKNFIFDNGLINILLSIKKDSIFSRLFSEQFENNNWIFDLTDKDYKFNFKVQDTKFTVESLWTKTFTELLLKLFSDSKQIIKQSKDKYDGYYDINLKNFVNANKIYAEGVTGGDLKSQVLWIPLELLKDTQEEIENKLLEFNLKFGYSLKSSDILNSRSSYVDTEFNSITSDKPTLCVKVYGTLEQFNKNFINYLIKSDFIDSRTYEFGMAKDSFFDLKNSKTINNKTTIDENLIYQLAISKFRYFEKIGDDKLVYFFHSDSLVDLFDIKSKTVFLDEGKELKGKGKNGEEYTITKTNIDYKILNDYDFFTRPEFNLTREFKLLFYLYKKIQILEQEDKQNEWYFSSFLSKNPTLYFYKEWESLKSTLECYQKINKLFWLFKQLEDKKVLATLVLKNNSILNNIGSEDNKAPSITNKLITNILNFTSLRKNYMEIQQNFERSLPSGLKEFESIYLEYINKNEDKFLNELCYKLSQDLGLLISDLKEDGFLFKLRNVKNNAQLISFFNDIYFLILKKQETAKITKDFKEYLNTLLSILNKNNWEQVKDYIWIYTIQRYKSVSFAKSN